MPLNSASNNGHVDVVKLLLEKGADWTVPNNDGWMPLNCASNNGHVDVVKLLFEKGADWTISK
jgi:ankyrin repeat protein